MDRLKVATVWFGGCSGCHMSFLDLDEFLLDLGDKVELVYSPVVDVKEYPEGVDVCLMEGAICNEDNLDPVFETMVPLGNWNPITQVLVLFDRGPACAEVRHERCLRHR